jgi:hypothetical protein
MSTANSSYIMCSRPCSHRSTENNQLSIAYTYRLCVPTERREIYGFGKGEYVRQFDSTHESSIVSEAFEVECHHQRKAFKLRVYRCVSTYFLANETVLRKHVPIALYCFARVICIHETCTYTSSVARRSTSFMIGASFEMSRGYLSRFACTHAFITALTPPCIFCVKNFLCEIR